MIRSFKRLKSEESANRIGVTDEDDENKGNHDEGCTLLYSRIPPDISDQPSIRPPLVSDSQSHPTEPSLQRKEILSLHTSMMEPVTQKDSTSTQNHVTLVMEMLNEASELCRKKQYLECKTLLSKIYHSIDQCDTENDKIEAYDRCFKIFSECKDRMNALLCFYKILLLREEQLPFGMHIQQSAALWICGIAESDNEMAHVFLTMDSIFEMAEKHLRTNPLRYSVVLSVMLDLVVTYKNMMLIPRLSREEMLFIQSKCRKVEWKLPELFYCSGLYTDVCNMFMRLSKCGTYISPSELEIWAKALEKTNKIDIAIKKVEEALTVLKLNDRSYYQKMETYRQDLYAMQDKQNKDNSTDISCEWLESSTILENKRCREKRDQVEKEQRSTEKKCRHRPKRRQCEETPLVNFEKESPLSNIALDITSWKDVTDFSFIPCQKGKKRKRRPTGASDVSSSSGITVDILQDLDTENTEENEFCLSDSDGFGERPSDLPCFDDWSGDDAMSVVEPSDDNEGRDDQEISLFEMSMNAFENNDKRQNIGLQEMQLLREGIKLSERCKKQYCTRIVNGKKFKYEDEFSKEELLRLCKQQPQKYKTCELQIQSSHRAVCLNKNPNDDITLIEISGRSKCGKAYNEDTVVVELFQNSSLKENIIPRLNVNLNKRQMKNNTIYGHVRGVLERKKFPGVDHPVFVCTLDEFQNYLVKPLCKTIPKISIQRKHCKNNYQVDLYNYDEEAMELRYRETKGLDLNMKKSYLFLVAMIDWEEQYPSGVVLKMSIANSSGTSGEDVISLQHQAPFLFREITIQRVTSVIETMPDEPSGYLMEGRKDFSDDLKVFTVDPQGSRDLDDAISIRRNDTENLYEVGVHISDVTTLVLKDDPVDKEAYERATTFYPGRGSRPLHMLPEPLSTNLCSLIPGKKRLALSIFFKLGTDGKLKDKPVVTKTVIKSQKKYSYEQVQQIIDGNETQDDFAEDILTLFAITNEMKNIRVGHRRFAFPVETDLLEEIECTLDTRDAHSLIEELMILTNLTIANFVSRSSKQTASVLVLRCQNSPSPEKVRYWVNQNPLIANFVLHLQNFRTDQSHILSINDESMKLRYRNIIPFQKWVWNEMTEALEIEDFRKLNRLIGTDDLHPEIAVALREWTTFMESAEYKCLGELKNPKTEGTHFSLGIFPYVHFTSPIRRYADIMVHRLVHAVLDQNEAPYKRSQVHDMCQHLNERMKRAKQFQNDSTLYSWGLKLSNNPRVVHGIVQKVSNTDIVLHVPGMRSLPKNCTELPLNLLNVCNRPSINNDTDNEKDILTLCWQRRIYSATGFYIRPRFQRTTKLEIQRIDPHQRATFQQLKKWQNITSSVVNEKPNKTLRKAFRNPDTPDVNMDQSVKACFNTEEDVSSEVPKGNIVHQKCSYSMSFNHAQIVALQLNAEPERGIMIPSIEMFDMTKNVKYCLQHMKNPIGIFSRPSTVATKTKYSSHVDYICTWLPIVTMEAATNAVANDPAVINDLHVLFEQGGGIFSLRKSYCDRRDIYLKAGHLESILLGKCQSDDKEDREQVEYLTSSDYLCIRCEVSRDGRALMKHSSDTAPSQRKFWIGHARTDKIKCTKDGKINVHFELTKNTPCPCPAMLGSITGVQCCVEIIKKTDDDRRTETILKFLGTASLLAKAIALGSKIPKLDAEHIRHAQQIGDYVDVPGLHRNNEDQRIALKKSMVRSFSLIQGPPGTGKTRTAINLLLLFCRINQEISEAGGARKQVLFCGPSNKSVDLVAKWMMKHLGNGAPKCVRMYGSSLENMDFPVPGKVFSSRSGDTKPDPEIKSISLHHLIRQDGSQYADKIKSFDRMFKNEAETADFGSIKDYCKTLRKASKEILEKYDVILCTSTTATSTRLLESCRGNIFQLILDEAGMCTEPQSMATIIATRAEQVILIGDHEQLRPIVKVSHSKDLGMEKSLFERYAQRASFLSSQYRMNPKLCAFPSKQFYKDKLHTMQSSSWDVIEPLKMWLDPDCPHVFCHIEGQEECLTVSTEEGNQQSRSNKEEIEQVLKVVQHMVKKEAVQQNTINVISQYSAQCYGIREILKKNGLSTVNVNTVVASQGGEWDYVVFSTVRSLPDYRIEPYPTAGWCHQNLGFIVDGHQINVALTRAKKGLVIIGNKHLLKCERNVWRNLLQHYERNHCLVDGENFPRVKHNQHRRRSGMFSTQTSVEFYANTEMAA